jgi:hypothetical protein
MSIISVYDNIITAAQYGLTTITQANGYNNTILHAYSPPIEVGAMIEMPCVNIYEGTDSCSNANPNGPHEQTGGNQAKLFNDFDLIFECYLNVQDNPRAARNSLKADIQKYFGLHWNIPDSNGIPSAFSCMYHSAEPFGQNANAPQTGFVGRLKVWYSQQLTDPTKISY